MDAKTSEWRPGPSVCRCCLTEGCYKDISTEYFWMGKREVYAEMLSETLNVSISYSQAGGPNSNSRLICEPCISRLRDASDFRRQVVECEKSFMQHLDPCSSMADIEVNLEPLGDGVKLECVKLEKSLSDDDYDDRCDFPDDDDDDDDLDDQPLTKLASRIPKKETVDIIDIPNTTKSAEKRKSTTKIKLTPVKKTKVVKIEPMKAGVSKMPTKVAGKLSTKVGGKAASKTTQKTTEKKKKGKQETPTPSRKVIVKWKRKLKEDCANAAAILEHSNATPFRYKRGKFMCAYCNSTFFNLIELRAHSATHQTLQLFKRPARNLFPLRVDISELACNICSTAIQSIDDLKSHLIEEHKVAFNKEFSDGVIPFVLTKYNCLLCGVEFKGFLSLFVHMNEHYKTFVCPTCGKGFSWKHSLRAHLRNNHEVGSFKCTKCDEVFPTNIDRSKHMIAAHKFKGTYTCPVCNVGFISYSSRTKHLRSEHSGAGALGMK